MASLGGGSGRLQWAMIVTMITVHMVQMAVMEVINVAGVADGLVTTIGSMNV